MAKFPNIKQIEALRKRAEDTHKEMVRALNALLLEVPIGVAVGVSGKVADYLDAIGANVEGVRIRPLTEAIKRLKNVVAKAGKQADEPQSTVGARGSRCRTSGR